MNNLQFSEEIVYESDVALCSFCNGNGCSACKYTGVVPVVLEIRVETGEVIGVYDLDELHSFDC